MTEKVILMILNQKFPPDIRVEQEYDVLSKEGYRVVVVANEGGEENSKYEIIRIDHTRGKSSSLNMTLRYNPFLRDRIIAALRAINIFQVDAVHVHDLFWSFLGIQLRKYYKCKIIIDLHKNYPAYMKDIKDENKILRKNENSKTLFRTKLRHPFVSLLSELQKRAYSISRLVKYEDRILMECDRFIVVVEEALESFRHKEYFKKGVIVRNTKDHNLWKFVNLPELKGPLIISYVGSVQYLRGIDTVITSMKYLNQSDFVLNIVGINPNSKLYDFYKNILSKNNISNVNLIPWLNNEKDAFRFIENSHVCIIPHYNTGLTRETVPHKLFMYMATGRPTIASDVAPLKRILEETSCGLIFKAGDSTDLAEKLKQIRDPVLLSELSINGRKYAENQYSWDIDKQRLVGLYKDLLV